MDIKEVRELIRLPADKIRARLKVAAEDSWEEKGPWGSLRVTPAGVFFTSQRLLVDEGTHTARASICATCAEKRGDECVAMSCGCSLTQRQESALGECPRKLWAPFDKDKAIKVSKENRIPSKPTQVDEAEAKRRFSFCEGCPEHSKVSKETAGSTMIMSMCRVTRRPVRRELLNPAGECPLKKW